MKISTYQRHGTMPGKVEMEDRIVAGKNVLASGYHCIDELDTGVFAVFDGVGGLKGSAFAAALAAKTFSDAALPMTFDAIRSMLSEIHTDLIRYSTTATTATGLVWNGEDQTMLFHIGNTRVSGICDGYIRTFTEDQTQYTMMQKSGAYEGDIPKDGKSTLLACLGAREDLIESLVVSDISQELSRCSKILITSDGIHDSVSVDDLESFLQHDISLKTLEELASAAIRAGSRDDLSILVIER